MQRSHLGDSTRAARVMRGAWDVRAHPSRGMHLPRYLLLLSHLLWLIPLTSLALIRGGHFLQEASSDHLQGRQVALLGVFQEWGSFESPVGRHLAVRWGVMSGTPFWPGGSLESIVFPVHMTVLNKINIVRNDWMSGWWIYAILHSPVAEGATAGETFFLSTHHLCRRGLSNYREVFCQPRSVQWGVALFLRSVIFQ